MQTEKITNYFQKICFNFHTIHSIAGLCHQCSSESLILMLGFMYGRLTKILGILQSVVKIIFSLFIFICFWGAVESMRKKMTDVLLSLFAF